MRRSGDGKSRAGSIRQKADRLDAIVLENRISPTPVSRFRSGTDCPRASSLGSRRRRRPPPCEQFAFFALPVRKRLLLPTGSWHQTERIPTRSESHESSPSLHTRERQAVAGPLRRTAARVATATGTASSRRPSARTTGLDSGSNDAATPRPARLAALVARLTGHPGSALLELVAGSCATIFDNPTP